MLTSIYILELCKILRILESLVASKTRSDTIHSPPKKPSQKRIHSFFKTFPVCFSGFQVRRVNLGKLRQHSRQSTSLAASLPPEKWMGLQDDPYTLED